MLRAIVLAALCACGSVSAQEPTPKVRPLPTAELNRLVEQLGSRDYRERERASRTLAEEGDRALPLLKAGLDKTESPEVQRRLEVLIAKLNSERVFRPTTVTVDCKNASVKTVLKDVCKQAGYKFQDGIGTDQKITLKLPGVPFWEAVGAIGDATGLIVVAQDDDQKTVSAYGNDTYSPHSSVSGAFRFTASNINSNRNVQLSNIPRRSAPQNPEYIGMGVQIQAEPKLPLVGVGVVTLVKAIDDKGVSLIPANADESRRAVRHYVPSSYRSLNQSCSVTLQRGHREATTIRELEAKVAVAILVEERPEITVENLLGAKKKKYAGNTLDIELDEVSEAMGTVSLKVFFRQRDANPEDYNWSNTAVQRMVVLDDKGVKMTSNGVTEQNTGAGVATMRISYSPVAGKKPGKPATLIVNEWISETREIAFKFKNVPLP